LAYLSGDVTVVLLWAAILMLTEIQKEHVYLVTWFGGSHLSNPAGFFRNVCNVWFVALAYLSGDVTVMLLWAAILMLRQIYKKNMYTWLPDLAALSPLESCRFLQKCMQCVICAHIFALIFSHLYLNLFNMYFCAYVYTKLMSAIEF
jgi:hypothetical protein